MTSVILFVFGAIIGSFLNVVGLRWDLPRRGGKSFAGRSTCQTCGKTLRWFELVPVFSFLAQRGTCRTCGAKISWQYPAVEIFTGLVFLSIYNLGLSVGHTSLFLVVFCIYIVILIYDLWHKIIPDELVFAAIFLSLLTPLFFVDYSLFDWLAGPAIFAFFGSIWFLSNGRAMGFGDAKLGASIGLLLGAREGLSAIILAFWLGAATSLVYMFLLKTGFIKNAEGLTMKSEIPFAPFIILGAWLTITFGFDFFYVSSY